MVAILRSFARAVVPRRVRNWLRKPGGTILWARDQAAHALGLDRVVAIRSGWSLRCHPAAYRLAYRAHVEDPEQVPELDAFIAHCAPHMVLLDAGAHFGLFSLAALHFGGPGGRAVAVEPSPAAVRMLRIQSILNGVADHLTVIPAAISDRDGTMDLVDAGVGSARYFVPPERSHMGSERTSVRTIAADSLIAQLGLVPTHIKIDVEGHEAAVLRGAERTLRGASRPLLFVELHNEIVTRQGRDPAETLEILERCGYAVFDLFGSRLERDAILSRPLTRIVAKSEAAQTQSSK